MKCRLIYCCETHIHNGCHLDSGLGLVRGFLLPAVGAVIDCELRPQEVGAQLAAEALPATGEVRGVSGDKVVAGSGLLTFTTGQ